MIKHISTTWADAIIKDLNAGLALDITSSEPIVHKFLIQALAKRNRAYAVHNLGCGVKRITTETTTCPCCKRPL